MFSKFASFLFAFLFATSASQAINFKTTIGRIVYTLNTENKTATINRVYVFWPEETVVKLKEYIMYDGKSFKVTDISKNAFKNYVSLDISKINVPNTINKTKENKDEYSRIFKSLSESNKDEINNYFGTRT